MPRFPRGVGPVDAANPVEWGHPLNAGRLAWWLGLAGLGRGDRLPDLALGRAATLVNGAAYAADRRPGSLGGEVYLAGDAGGDTAALDRPAILGAAAVAATSADWTLALWYKQAGVAEDAPIVFGSEHFAPPGVAIVHERSVDGLAMFANGDGGYAESAQVTLADGDWHHAVFVADSAAGDFRCHKDGVAVDARSYPTAWGSIALSSRFVSGYRWDGGTTWAWAQATVDDLSAWPRAFSAADAAALYEQSRRGHPDTLRRLSRRSTFLMAPPAATFRAGWLSPSPSPGTGVY